MRRVFNRAVVQAVRSGQLSQVSDSLAGQIELPSGIPVALPDAAIEYTFSYTLDSPYLSSWGRDYRARVYEPETNEYVGDFPFFGTSGFTVSDQAGLYAFGAGKGVAVYPIRGGDPVAEIEVEGGSVTVLSFSPDGTRLAAGIGDGRAQVWDVATWEVIDDSLGTADDRVTSMRYSPDGRFLVTVDDRGLIPCATRTPMNR
jgi:WD40 repeat protein